MNIDLKIIKNIVFAEITHDNHDKFNIVTMSELLHQVKLKFADDYDDIYLLVINTSHSRVVIDAEYTFDVKFNECSHIYIIYEHDMVGWLYITNSSYIYVKDFKGEHIWLNNSTVNSITLCGNCHIHYFGSTFIDILNARSFHTTIYAPSEMTNSKLYIGVLLCYYIEIKYSSFVKIDYSNSNNKDIDTKYIIRTGRYLTTCCEDKKYQMFYNSLEGKVILDYVINYMI